MQAGAKIPIVLVVGFLWVSVIATTITFPLDFWLINTTSNMRYGMWSFCQDLSSTTGGQLCYSYYDVAQTSLTNYYKAFQAFQCGMLGFATIALFLVLMNIAFCYKSWLLFIFVAFLVALAIICATVSLIIYGIKIYDPTATILGWCFWLSVGSGASLLFALFFIIIYLIVLGFIRDRPKKTNRTEINETAITTTTLQKRAPSYRNSHVQPTYRYDDEPSPKYAVRGDSTAEYRSSIRWEQPTTTIAATKTYYQPYTSYDANGYNTTRSNNHNWSYYDETTAYPQQQQTQQQTHVARSQV